MTTAAASASAAYAVEVARLLWPAPWEPPYVTRRRHRSGQAGRDAYLFPSRRYPRLMVPADVPGCSSMLRRLGAGRSILVGPLRALLEVSVRSRVFAWTRWPMLRVSATDPAADSIERYLADRLGCPVRVGVLLGTRRVNQKPVLQVFDLTGQVLGYAKIGHNPLTAALVRREAEALGALGQFAPRSFRAPVLLHHGQWAGLEVLVISALPTTSDRAVTATARLAAMREVAQLSGASTSTLARSRFWQRLQHDIDLLAGEHEAPLLGAAARAIEAAHGADLVQLGGWHGDWGRWNMGMGGGDLMLWDWERYDPEVPIGFDGLHFDAQLVRPGERDARRQEQTFLASAPASLAALGVPADQHDLTLRLYLLEIAVRYVDALAHGATPALRRRTSWVLALLAGLLEHPQPLPSEGRP